VNQVVALDTQELGMFRSDFGALLGLRVLLAALDACLDNRASLSDKRIRLAGYLAAGAFHLGNSFGQAHGVQGGVSV